MGPHELGETFDEMLGMPGEAGDLIRFGGHASMSFFAGYYGWHEEGAWSVLGWAVSGLSAATAVMDLISLAKR